MFTQNILPEHTSSGNYNTSSIIMLSLLTNEYIKNYAHETFSRAAECLTNQRKGKGKLSEGSRIKV